MTSSVPESDQSKWIGGLEATLKANVHKKNTFHCIVNIPYGSAEKAEMVRELISAILLGEINK